jgi:hypothetical protein
MQTRFNLHLVLLQTRQRHPLLSELARPSRHRILGCLAATALISAALPLPAKASYNVMSWADNGYCSWSYNHDQVGGSGATTAGVSPPESQVVSGTTDTTGTATSAFAMAADSGAYGAHIFDTSSTETATANLATASASVKEYDTAVSDVYGGHDGGVAQSEISDLLTFNVPGATPSTVTNITAYFNTAGHMLPSGTDPYIPTEGGTGPGASFDSVATFDSLSGGSAVEEYDAYFDVNLDATQNNDALPYVAYATSSWAGGAYAVATPSNLEFSGMIALDGINPQLSVDLLQQLDSSDGMDTSYLGNITFLLPDGVTYTSDSGVFGTQPVPEPTALGVLTMAGGLALRRRRIRRFR